MKILLVTGNYLPGKKAGIENYTHWIARVLMENNFEVEVAALNVKEASDYIYEGIKVNYLKNKFSTFNSLLKTGKFDICHFQEYSEHGIELFWFKLAKQNCNKVFFTFHLPYLTCYKGDFRYMGISDCNNFSSSERCAECIIATKLNYRHPSHFRFYNFGINLIVQLIKKTGKITTIKKNIQTRRNDLKELINTCDNIFIYGAWFKRILNNNGYNSPVIKEIPHMTKSTPLKIKENDFSIKNKLLFVGRIEKLKGLHLICKAMNLISNADLQIDVYGNITNADYYNICKSTYDFNYKGSVPRAELLKKLLTYDFLVLPSVFTEMYSLILKEAFYEELPAIVSSAKGNQDVVKEGINGFVFEYDNYKELARVIDKAYELKRKGWKPVFEKSDLQVDNIRNILSYYC